ncbi:hypothetical protein NPIL_380001 [Nephila pilipes]|uniref:Uncharacterized protein n=1 Tax=Nephila pilipes TaxID=299642 RepID=A0A8X6MRC6_NEPPI|nr:hypothetical protein NPIL_380001 [Nephila pilipes]
MDKIRFLRARSVRDNHLHVVTGEMLPIQVPVQRLDLYFFTSNITAEKISSTSSSLEMNCSLHPENQIAIVVFAALYISEQEQRQVVLLIVTTPLSHLG